MRELRELSIFELKEKCKVLGLKGYQNLRTNRTLIEKIKKHFVPLSVDKIKEKYTKIGVQFDIKLDKEGLMSILEETTEKGQLNSAKEILKKAMDEKMVTRGEKQRREKQTQEKQTQEKQTQEKQNRDNHTVLIMESSITQTDIIHPKDYTLMDVSKINKLPSQYPDEFNDFCQLHKLKVPNINTGNGKALSVMLEYKYCYWNRDTCDEFVNKFNIITKDSIQLFNKHNQWGIQTNSGKDKGKLYIVYPYGLSNKHKMRKNFKYSGTLEEKNEEINKIKSTIKTDYIDVPNDEWQLGHKNPGSTDNTNDNLVLQPPIQGKYRDNYIFIDTLTKFPMPHKLEYMIHNKEIELTKEQIISYKAIFDKLFDSV